MKTALCPSCGAPVEFRSAASVYAVCAFCQSTLLRDGEDLKNLGRMADLMDDPSLIQIGSEGTFRGLHFAVIGRIQLKHASGLWNEWYILFDDGRGSWLSEAGGEYVVSGQVAVNEALPAFETLKPEMQISVAGRPFTVTDLETARCIAGQGELPFKVDAGYDVNTADLRGGDRFVTIDYSETPPLVFVGYPATFDALKLANLRDAGTGTSATIKAQAFNCPHCAAPLTVHSGAIESIACDSCGSIIGIDNAKVQLLSRAAHSLRIPPPIPLGSKGRLNDIDWEAIGFMQRSTRSDGVDYPWTETLLFNAEQGFAWLVEYQGHWNFARTLSNPPPVGRGLPAFLWQKERYKLFNRGSAEVTYVVGEFYWRVAVGESCLVEDYVCPPRLLSREVSDKEVSWSLSEYVEPEMLCATFQLKAPPAPRVGVYANQPNPLVERSRRVFSLFWKLALAATAIQLAFAFVFSSHVVLKQAVVLSPFNAEAALTTQTFVLDKRARALRVEHDTDVENNWVDINSTLVEKTTGEAYQGAQEISYYRGVDDGESWSEGSRSDAISFKDIPAGTYYLNVEYDLGTDRKDAIADTIEVTRNPASWSNYVLVMVFLALFPLYARWRANAFEVQRWNESDLGGGDGASAGNDEDDE